MAKKHNAEILLSALLAGRTLEINNYKYILGEDENTGDKKLAIVAQCFKGDEEYEKLLGADMSFDSFLKMANELSEEDIVGVVFDKVMSDMNPPRG